MIGLQPVAGELRISAIGRGDKRTTIAVKPADVEHYRATRARTGRVLQSRFKAVEGFSADPAAV
jgi:hypothetical protein